MSEIRLVTAPVQDAFTNDVIQTDGDKAEINEHFPEAKEAGAGNFRQLAVDDGPGHHEDRFHIEEDEQNGNKVVANAESGTRVADRLNPPFNVVISNVPGPRQPLYAAGARMKHFYPVSTVTDGQGLNITVQSYTDTLDFGLVSCRELVPDLWDLLQMCLDEVQSLMKG